MANVVIYNNATSNTRTVSVDIVGADCLVPSVDAAYDPSAKYFMVFATTAKDSNGVALPSKVVHSHDDLVLNHTKRSASDSVVAYDNITLTVEDIVYDYIHGHTADQYTSGCTAQLAMKWS